MAVLHQPDPWLDLEWIGGGQQVLQPPATILLMCSPRKPLDPLLQLAPNWVEATIRSSMPWHNSNYDWEKIPCLLIWSWLICSQFNFLGADRSGESLPSIAIRKGPNLSRMRPPSSLNGDIESVPLRRLAASIHLGLHCCVAVAVFRTGGPVNHHPRRGGKILWWAAANRFVIPL